MRKPLYPLKGRVVLITGAASGIGRALSHEAAREGARLALLDKDAQGLSRIGQEIQGMGGSARTYVCDLADAGQTRQTAQRIQQELAAVDVLINSAARGVEGLVEDVPLEDFKACHDVNFYGPLALIQTLIPGMKRAGDGQIVNLSTTMGRRAFPGKVSYCVTKFALNALTEGLRLELAPFGINVMMVSPGPTESNLYQTTTRHGNLKVGFDQTVKRQDPARIAKKIIRGIERRSRTVIQWTPSEVLVRIHGVFPRLVDLVLSRVIPVPGPPAASRP
ncbi:MAG: SDR family oxidoreductase [Candidatus Omnitrophica bacterium]|nr:SDR family oxidoreductase [Candidatus Omnitrophota bacterium]